MINKVKKILRFSSVCIVSLVSFPVIAANSVIDVLVVYTQGTADLYGGDPTTRFNQIFQVTNQIYSDSGVNLEIRLAGSLKVNYTDDNSAETALNDITYNRVAAFNGVTAAREQYKADMVVFYRPYKDIHGSCGVAWIGGQGSNGDFSSPQYKGYMFAHVAINSCGDYVTAHELGHNMGLKHSRKQDGTGGTSHYALGYGVACATTISFDCESWAIAGGATIKSAGTTVPASRAALMFICMSLFSFSAGSGAALRYQFNRVGRAAEWWRNGRFVISAVPTGHAEA
jgi:hypothetical protein